MSNFHICKVINYRTYNLHDPSGHICCASTVDIHMLMPPEYTVSLLPD